MKYFLDTEFVEDGRTIDLISIGIVCEDGREFYKVSKEFDLEKAKANKFVSENVLPFIGNVTPVSKKAIKTDLIEFLRLWEGKPEFWGWFASYDWVALCQLFGTMMDLPRGMPMFIRDLRCIVGQTKLPQFDFGDEHNALADAKELKARYEWYMCGLMTGKYKKIF